MRKLSKLTDEGSGPANGSNIQRKFKKIKEGKKEEKNNDSKRKEMRRTSWQFSFRARHIHIGVITGLK